MIAICSLIIEDGILPLRASDGSPTLFIEGPLGAGDAWALTVVCYMLVTSDVTLKS